MPSGRVYSELGRRACRLVLEKQALPTARLALSPGRMRGFGPAAEQYIETLPENMPSVIRRGVENELRDSLEFTHGLAPQQAQEVMQNPSVRKLLDDFEKRTAKDKRFAAAILARELGDTSKWIDEPIKEQGKFYDELQAVALAVANERRRRQARAARMTG